MTRPRSCRTGPHRVRGVTLVELMVGLAIGLFLVGVGSLIFLGSKGTFQSQNHVGRLQESARFVADTINADLRMAGFRGCRGFGATTPLTNTLNTPTGFRYNFGQGVWASRYSSSTWSPALDSVLTGLVPAPTSAGDVLTIRRAWGPGWALTAEMASATAVLNVSAGSTVRQGDLLMVSDCAGAAVLQATNATPGADGAIEHSSAVTLTPGLSTASLGRPFLQDALVHRLATSTYYLAPSTRTGKTDQRALWVHTTPSYDGTTYPQELVTGVERLAVRLGLDGNGDGGVESYVMPHQVTDWAQVTAVQIDLLLASTEDFVTTEPQPYLWNGARITPTDRRQRTVVSLTASVRNATR